MGNYISLGFVFSKGVGKIENELELIFKNLFESIDKIKIKYPLDNNYECWNECDFGESVLYKDAFNILSENKMAQGIIKCRIGLKYYNVLVRVITENEFTDGILLEVPEYEIMHDDYSNHHFNCITTAIVEALRKLMILSNYQYAFCDNEAEFEYDFTEINNLKSLVYSIFVFRGENDEPKIYLADWNIDGLTPR